MSFSFMRMTLTEVAPDSEFADPSSVIDTRNRDVFALWVPHNILHRLPVPIECPNLRALQFTASARNSRLSPNDTNPVYVARCRVGSAWFFTDSWLEWMDGVCDGKKKGVKFSDVLPHGLMAPHSVYNPVDEDDTYRWSIPTGFRFVKWGMAQFDLVW